MANSESPASPAGDGDNDDGFRWGRVLDAAGAVAGVLLIVICADILTDGRLISRRIMARRPPAPAPEPEPEASDG
jgi:hypothetical protein